MNVVKKPDDLLVYNLNRDEMKIAVLSQMVFFGEPEAVVKIYNLMHDMSQAKYNKEANNFTITGEIV